MRSGSGRRGFTLIELMVVMTIIGILLSLVLRAYSGSVRTAELKATESLIAKLEQAMIDRMDALATYRADPTPAHFTLASLNAGTAQRVESVQRAQAIAQFDYLRAQLPDVFMVTTNTNYPLNFAGMPFGGTADLNYQLPIGNATTIALGGSWDGNPATLTPGTGIYGASYEIAGGIYKQLGYGPQGYDGNDNNLNGLVDESGEGVTPAQLTAIQGKLGLHKHKTARSEMLYAILVEGGGPYGSAFDKDDFTTKEVQDTDGDGLLEFVDAWGEPLQFYRWPVLYHSDSQKGFPPVIKLVQDVANTYTPGPYTSVYESREQNPIDPNQTLMAPAWWGAKYNASTFYSGADATKNISGAAATFMAHFGPLLVDPIALSQAKPSPNTYWDRSAVATPAATGALFYRRAYYSRPLILSAGPDKIPGTAQVGVAYKTIDDRSTIETPSGVVSSGRDASGTGATMSVANLLIEGQGGKVDPTRSDTLGTLSVLGANGRNDTNSQLEYYAQDDISNQMLQATGGVTH